MPSRGRPSRRARRLSAYLATCPSSSAIDSGVKAATAACCASAGGQMVKLPVSTSTGRRRSSGTSIQPSRHPVIEKYFENDPNVTPVRDVCQADDVAAPDVEPVETPYVMPW